MSSAKWPFWTIPGVFVGSRQLLGGAEKQPFKVVATVMAMGGTYELQSDDLRFFDAVGAGQDIEAIGTFGMYGNKIQLNVARVLVGGKLVAGKPA